MLPINYVLPDRDIAHRVVMGPLKIGKFVTSWGRSQPKRPVSPDDHDIEPDIVHIDGGLEEVWHPPNNKTASVHHVLVNIVVFFILSRPLDVGTIKAHFEGILDVDFVGPRFRTSFLSLQWVLWNKGKLQAGRKYRFDVIAEIPTSTPCSFVSTKGIIEYLFHVNFDDGADGGGLIGESKTVTVWNPHLVFDIPRPGLIWGGDMESEMVGNTIEIYKDLTAFVRYPDQWFNSTYPNPLHWLICTRSCISC
jgi:hypothetical protein